MSGKTVVHSDSDPDSDSESDSDSDSDSGFLRGIRIQFGRRYL